MKTNPKTGEIPQTPHRRQNLLSGEWILVSPHRTFRPWQGSQENRKNNVRKKYDPDCYLCPGNKRANDRQNPSYTSTYVFTNDFPALLPETGISQKSFHPLLQYESVRGTCRVICFSPRHDLTLADMSPDDISKVINVWSDETTELGKTYRWVQIFENKGEMMGASNPHPHCQIWASSFIPNEIKKEERQQVDYFNTHRSPLLTDYLETETVLKQRIILENDHWVILVPFWATWPFETIIIPRRHILHFPDLTIDEKQSLSVILKQILIKYDNLFQISFPYSMGWHGAPRDENDYRHWQLHGHFYPPLLRSGTVKKHMVGYELLAEPQRDITPEIAAEQLRTI